LATTPCRCIIYTAKTIAQSNPGFSHFAERG
jgi:hypothetical protein